MFFWLTHCDASPSKQSQHLHRQRTSSYMYGHNQKIGVHFRSSSSEHYIPRVLQGPLSPQFSNCFHLGRSAYSKMLRRYVYNLMNTWGFPGGASGKESAWDTGSVSGREDPLEEETTTHSSILAWEIPWTEEPSGLQSMGSQRVTHDWVSTRVGAHTHTQSPFSSRNKAF